MRSDTKPVRIRHVAAAVAVALGGTYAPLAYAQDSVTLDEIIVTARKKEESIQDIPVAVSAISESLIQDLTLQDLSDISKLTAGLLFDNEFSRQSNRPVIRGQANILGDSGVSYFIDGVYITGSIADYDLNEIERLEIVKGPQSALYGRNTYSGAINIITRSPGEEFSGRVQVEVSEDDQFELSAGISGPLIDGVLSGGVNLRHFELGGPFTNEFDGNEIGEQESTSASAVLEWTPTDSIRARLRAYYADLNDGQAALFHQSALDNNCFTDNGALYGGGGRYFCGTVEPGEINTDVRFQAPDARLESEKLQTSLRLDFELNEQSSLTSITGYNRDDSIDISDGDYQPTSFQTAVFTPGGFPFAGFPVPPFSFGYVGTIVDFTFANLGEEEDISQELRYSYDGDNLDVLLGAYYFKQDSLSQSIRDLPAGAAGAAGANFGAAFGEQIGLCAQNPICGSIVPFFGPTIDVPRDASDLEIENTALFGLVSFDLTDTLSITAEARFQEEDIEQAAVAQDLGGPITNRVNASASFDSFSPRFTVDYKAGENSLLYALYAEGTKPGGFNGVVAIDAGLPTFDEEEVTSFELGSKNVWANGQLTANFSLFFNQIDGYQLTQNARSGANTTSATVNAGDADINGLEAEFSYRPVNVEGLTVTFNYAYTDAEFTDGVDENQGVLNDAADNGLVDCSIGDQFPDPNDPTACNESLFGSIDGNQVPRTAEHQAFLDVDLRRPLAGTDWEFFVGGNVSFESSKFAQVHNQAETGETTLVNARFGFQNEQFAINFWGRNLTGEDSTPLVLRYADGAESFRRSFVGTLRRDTYYGVTATVRF
ncbi:MAG: TonB-dependent receptor [Pseudomonadota bacterium]